MHMPQMTLYVRLRKSGGKDHFGNETYEYSVPIAVEGCMFAPTSTQDLSAARPDGVEISATAYFPRGWAQQLRGALVSVDKQCWLYVVGAPVGYPKEMLPKGFKFECQVLLRTYGGYLYQNDQQPGVVLDG